MQENENHSMSNTVSTSMVDINTDGSIKPNTLFHRSHDKLHSRCIEYPFAASRIGDAQVILDVGSAKSNSIWLEWLDNLPISVYATDYDTFEVEYKNIMFYRSDVRDLPFQDESFDKVIAVSVVEHIGLFAPQVNAKSIPKVDINGDFDAVKELTRVLKKGGELIMTLPFGVNQGLILNGEARCYNRENISKFNSLLKPVLLDYYEYQYADYARYYPEGSPRVSLRKKTSQYLRELVQPTQKDYKKIERDRGFYGTVTWRRISLQDASAVNYNHTDGIICGVWKK